MKLERIYVLLSFTLILLMGGLTFQAEAQSNESSRTKQVRVYFVKMGDPADLEHNPSTLQPVMRSVNAAAPMRPAIEALLAGPTAEEEQRGFVGVVMGASIIKIAVKRGTAYVNFSSSETTKWGGDLGPFLFGDAVERTLKQFPNVRRTIVCLDGVVNFGDESGDPDIKCPKF